MRPNKHGILVVDDETFNLDALRRVFRREYQVFTANSGDEGLEILKEHEIAVIITDQRMPQMTGIEFLEKTIEDYPDTIRMVLTGFTDIDALIDAINKGKVYQYINKPWDATELKILVKRAIDAYNLTKENKGLLEELKIQNQRLEAALRKVELLESAKAQLCRFVPRSLRNIIEASPVSPALEKREQDVSMLFLDIAGYTKMCERLEQARVFYLVETYFSNFLDSIYNNNGDIIETSGDGLMIIFQNDDETKNAIQAVDTAISIQKKTQILNERLKGQFEPLAINIGINSGVTSLGATRFDGISGTRWTYTASGQTTNLAARLGTLAEGGAILIGPETARRVRESFLLKGEGERILKNIEKPVMVYEVLTQNSKHRGSDE